MIFKFRIISDEVELFVRNIEIQSSATFLDLHESIQKSVGYDSSQLASFYLADADWSREEQITLLDMTDGETDMMLMSEERLDSHLCAVNENLVYVFDFFSDRAFYVSVAEIKEEDSGVTYPLSIGAIGDAPDQIAMGDLAADMEAMAAEFDKMDKGGDGFDMDAFNKENGFDDDAMGGSWENIDDMNL